MSRGASSPTVEVRALLLSRVDYGDADLIVHLFTDASGKISALARGARRSTKRFAGALEPMHTLRVEMNERPRGELYALRGSQIAAARSGLTQNLEALTAAGKALSWVRRAAPQNTPDPVLWQSIHCTLDELASPTGGADADGLLGAFGLRLLEVLGWGMNLTGCVSCGKTCPPQRAAWIHPDRGGLMCRSCGGGPFQIAGAARQEMLLAAADDGLRLQPETAVLALKIVDRALGAHMGFEDTSRGAHLGRRSK